MMTRFHRMSWSSVAGMPLAGTFSALSLFGQIAGDLQVRVTDATDAALTGLPERFFRRHGRRSRTGRS